MTYNITSQSIPQQDDDDYEIMSSHDAPPYSPPGTTNHSGEEYIPPLNTTNSSDEEYIPPLNTTYSSDEEYIPPLNTTYSSDDDYI